MFVSTAFVAVACFLAARLSGDNGPLGWMLAVIGVPILLGVAVGVLRRDAEWIGYAAGVVIVLIGGLLP